VLARSLSPLRGPECWGSLLCGWLLAAGEVGGEELADHLPEGGVADRVLVQGECPVPVGVAGELDLGLQGQDHEGARGEGDRVAEGTVGEVDGVVGHLRGRVAGPGGPRRWPGPGWRPGR
jgi:hypothetical protein